MRRKDGRIRTKAGVEREPEANVDDDDDDDEDGEEATSGKACFRA